MIKVGNNSSDDNNVADLDMPIASNNELQKDSPMPEDDMENDISFESNGEEKSFDNDFDAGVEANEDDDPKRYIQQLTGKLSQKLRDYNESLGETDTDLNKYVAGMVVKQATKNLDEKDKKEIIQKINSDDNSDISNDEEPSDADLDSDSHNDDMNDGNDMPMESKIITCTKKQLAKLTENFGANNDLFNDDKERHETKMKSAKKTPLSSPFIAPNFK